MTEPNMEDGERAFAWPGVGSTATFPTTFTVVFTQCANDMVRLSSDDGEQIGDLIDDRAWRPDGYRYHDIFHFAYAAVLGWSPVTRYLLGCRRVEARAVSLIEDGARAKLTEEGVALLIFASAPEHGFFQTGSDVPDDLLEAAMRMTSGLEVSVQPIEAWRKAVVVGFDAWTTAMAVGDAAVSANTKAGVLEVVPLVAR